jgi:heme/copper-type cytochrome/quinol oxidase subunit 3
MATTAATTDLEIFSEAPPAPPARPRVLLVGTALAAGSAAMVMLSLIALYAKLRADVIADGQIWLPEEANVQLTPGSMGMVTLLLSLVTVAWAVQALRNDDRGHALMAFGITLLLGAAYINGAAYGWQQFGLGVTSSTQALLIYTITGRAAEGVSAAALYWFVTVGVYAAVWYTITIIK